MTLSRALARAFGLRLGGSLACLIALLTAVGLIEGASRTLGPSVATWRALLLALMAALEETTALTPAACLMAALATGCAWARSGELEGALASGRSPLSLAAPWCAVALAATLSSLLYQDTWGRRAATLKQAWAPPARAGKENLREALGRRSAWVSDGPYILHLPHAGTRPASAPQLIRFSEPVIYEVQKGRLVRVLVGQALEDCGGAWTLRDAQMHFIARPEVERQDAYPLELSVSGTDLIALSADPHTQTTRQLVLLAARRGRTGLDATAFWLAAYHRAATVVAAPVWIWAVAPLALTPNRRRSLAAALGGGTALLAGVLALGHLARLLVLSHKLPPLCGALAETVICLTLLGGYTQWRRLRRTVR